MSNLIQTFYVFYFYEKLCDKRPKIVRGDTKKLLGRMFKMVENKVRHKYDPRNFDAMTWPSKVKGQKVKVFITAPPLGRPLPKLKGFLSGSCLTWPPSFTDVWRFIFPANGQKFCERFRNFTPTSKLKMLTRDGDAIHAEGTLCYGEQKPQKHLTQYYLPSSAQIDKRWPHAHNNKDEKMNSGRGGRGKQQLSFTYCSECA